MVWDFLNSRIYVHTVYMVYLLYIYYFVIGVTSNTFWNTKVVSMGLRICISVGFCLQNRLVFYGLSVQAGGVFYCFDYKTLRLSFCFLFPTQAINALNFCIFKWKWLDYGNLYIMDHEGQWTSSNNETLESLLNTRFPGCKD